MRPLLAISNAIDQLNEKIGYICNLLVLLACGALVLTAPVSRVLLQVHYASDVLAGLASGSVWLLLCLSLAEGLRQRQALGR